MRRYLQGINGTPVMIFNGEAGDVSARLLKKGVDWNECIRYGEGIGAQLVYPRHPVEVQVDEITVTEIAHRIDYKPGENEYLLRQKERLKKELEGLHPESRRYQMITSCYLYDIEERQKIRWNAVFQKLYYLWRTASCVCAGKLIYYFQEFQSMRITQYRI